MDTTFLKELLNALKLEAVRFRVWCVLLFIAAAFIPLAVGYFWPNSYTAQTVIYSDRTTIIEPLLEGRASVAGNRAQVEEVIFSRQLLEDAAEDAGLITDKANRKSTSRVLGDLQSGLKVTPQGETHFEISYTAHDPAVAYKTVNSVVSAFLKHSAQSKREESLGAYTFIDAQVQAYKRQLEEAEQRLKRFRAQNTDGTEASVTSRINDLRNQVESLKINIAETKSRIASLKDQLSSESQYQFTKGRTEELRERRQALNAELESLLLRYQENYPDVVSLREQISALDNEIEELELGGGSYSDAERVSNPLYEDLRAQLAEAQVELTTQQRRMQSLVHLQEKEYERAERVAANEAELAELNRDYQVTRDVYEEMLQRKESARLSMALDLEGQGISYKIQDPASFPLSPSGFQYLHFAVAGPFFGLLAPFGLLFIYVVLDPRFRSVRGLQQQLEGIDVIGSIPHYQTPLSERLLRKDMVLLFALWLLAMSVYISLAISWAEGKN